MREAHVPQLSSKAVLQPLSSSITNRKVSDSHTDTYGYLLKIPKGNEQGNEENSWKTEIKQTEIHEKLLNSISNQINYFHLQTG
jgi:hypothetical protein